MNSIDGKKISAADLIDIQAFSKDNNGIKYLLTVIDIFSKLVWIVPLKRQNWARSCKCFLKILKERKASKMWIDEAASFITKMYENKLSSILRKTRKNLVSLKDSIELLRK